MYDVKEKRWIAENKDTVLLERCRLVENREDPSMQFLLADSLLTDLSAGGDSVVEAVYLMEKAAKAGHADAAFAMGQMFEYGWAVGLNLQDAQTWYSRAASLGSSEGDLALKRLQSLHQKKRTRQLVTIMAGVCLVIIAFFAVRYFKKHSASSPGSDPVVSTAGILVHENTSYNRTENTSDLSEKVLDMIHENDDADVVSGARGSARLVLKYSGHTLDISAWPAVQVIETGDHVAVVQFSDEADAQDCLQHLREGDSAVYAIEDTYRDYYPDTVSEQEAGTAASGTDRAETTENGIPIEYSDSPVYPPDDNPYVYTSSYTGESYYSWGVERMGMNVFAASLSQQPQPQDPVVVAVFDTGTVPCEETRDRILPGLTPMNPDGAGQDIDPAYSYKCHGTHVAGTILDCTRGLNIKVLPVRVMGSAEEWTRTKGSLTGASESCRLPDSVMAIALEYAIEQDVDVINMSMSHDLETSDAEEQRALGALIGEAISNGIVIVTSSGNDKIDCSKKWPAFYKDCITVSGVKSDDRLLGYSNYGDPVDVCAPAKDIRSNVPLGYFEKKLDTNDDGYTDKIIRCPNTDVAELEGTSMASPHIAALAAMLKLQNRYRTPAQIEQYIKDYAEDLGDHLYYGEGLPIASKFADNSANALSGSNTKENDKPESKTITVLDQLQSHDSTTSYQYDENGMLVQIHHENTGNIDTYQNKDFLRISSDEKSYRDNSRMLRTYEYDSDHHLLRESVQRKKENGEVEDLPGTEFEYDKNGHLLRMSDPDLVIEYEYDQAQNLVQYKRSFLHKVNNTDRDELCIYNYDKENRISSVEEYEDTGEYPFAGHSFIAGNGQQVDGDKWTPVCVTVFGFDKQENLITCCISADIDSSFTSWDIEAIQPGELTHYEYKYETSNGIDLPVASYLCVPGEEPVLEQQFRYNPDGSLRERIIFGSDLKELWKYTYRQIKVPPQYIQFDEQEKSMLPPRELYRLRFKSQAEEPLRWGPMLTN